VKNKEKISQRKNLRELRKAKAELSMLTSYLFECEEALKEYSLEWNRDINFIISELSGEKKEDDVSISEVNTSNNFQNSNFRQETQEEREEPNIKSNAPKWVKKAFRKIALKTHPDKLQDHENAEEMEELYSKANSAISEENYDLLIEICNTLGIENDIDPETELKYNVKRQDSIRDDLKKITESLPWIWCEAYEDLSLRKKVLASVLPHYGISVQNQDILDDILLKIKAE